MPRSPRNCIGNAVTRLTLSLIFGASVGMACGSFAASYHPTQSAQETIIDWMTAGMLLAIVFWLGSRATRSRVPHDSALSKAGQTATVRPLHSPTPFITRLAAYFHCNEQQLCEPKDPPRSRMPFWSIVDFKSWHGPKPTELIRKILERLSRHVHGP